MKGLKKTSYTRMMYFPRRSSRGAQHRRENWRPSSPFSPERPPPQDLWTDRPCASKVLHYEWKWEDQLASDKRVSVPTLMGNCYVKSHHQCHPQASPMPGTAPPHSSRGTEGHTSAEMESEGHFICALTSSTHKGTLRPRPPAA